MIFDDVLVTFAPVGGRAFICGGASFVVLYCSGLLISIIGAGWKRMVAG